MAAVSADEGSMYENLIASQRIGDWMRSVHKGTQRRQLTALKQLLKSVQSQRAYVDEALRSGVVNQLTSLLKRTNDEAIMELAADVITACCGAIAAPPQMSYFCCGEAGRVSIAEGSLSDGLGVRVWLAAHALARTIMAAPEIVRGCSVAEFGAGPGLVGLVASRLGAKQVVLTDSPDAVLRCLRASMAANTTADAAIPPLQQRAASTVGHYAQQQHGYDRGHHLNLCEPCPQGGLPNSESRAPGSGSGSNGDPEDADSCDDLDDLLSAEISPGSRKTASHQRSPDASWQQGTIEVRRLDWRDAVASEGGKAAPAGAPLSSCDCPTLDPSSKFEVILASDVIYEADSAAALAPALARHLQREGRALLTCPVRDQALFDLFLASIQEYNLVAQVQPISPLDSDSAIRGQAQDYEGGFQMVAIQHADATPYDWPWQEALSWQAHGLASESAI